MKLKLFTLMILFALFIQIPINASSVTELTAEQEKVKGQIDDANEKIMEYEADITSTQEKIDENNEKIEQLKAEAAENEKKIADSRDEMDSTLVMMQKLNNTNTLATYFYDENTLDNNYFLKLDNINTMFDSISSEMSTFIEEIEATQSDINEIEQIKAENKKELETLNKNLTEQQELETSLKEQLADIELEIGKVALSTTGGASSDNKQAIMSAAGISPSDYQYVDYILTKESGWNSTAANPMSSAYGLCQSLPGSKMASAGSDWKTNPVTQMKWCDNYATSRYGSWSSAYSFWISHHWW